MKNANGKPVTGGTAIRIRAKETEKRFMLVFLSQLLEKQEQLKINQMVGLWV